MPGFDLPEKEVVIFRNESCISAISKNIWLVQRTTHIIVMELKRWETAEIKYPLPILFPLWTYNCYWSTIQVFTFNFKTVPRKNWKIPIIIGQGWLHLRGIFFSLDWVWRPKSKRVIKLLRVIIFSQLVVRKNLIRKTFNLNYIIPRNGLVELAALDEVKESGREDLNIISNVKPRSS